MKTIEAMKLIETLEEICQYDGIDGYKLHNSCKLSFANTGCHCDDCPVGAFLTNITQYANVAIQHIAEKQKAASTANADDLGV